MNNNQKLAKISQFTEEEIAVLKSTVAKGTTDTELAYFIMMAKDLELNPFNKEIWAYKDKRGNLLTFAGRDGFLKKAQKSKNWNGMTSAAVYENDYFEVDIAKGEISHIPNFKDRGKILGAYCIVRPKNIEMPTFEWAEFQTYNKGYNVWKSHPEEMIKKVAETHALKKAFGIYGLQSEYDFEFKNTAKPINEKSINQKVIEALDKYQGDDKEDIRELCIEKKNNGEDTPEFYENILKTLKK
jgi:phage recombination protein Bet